MKALKCILKYALIAVLWIAVWWGASAAVNNSVILPAPGEVLVRVGELAFGENFEIFWLSIIYSVIRVIFGLICATAVAVLLGALAFKFSIVADILQPAVAIVKSTPVVSFIFIAFIAFSKNFDAMPAFISGLIVFPVMYESILASLKATPRELVEVSEVFGCTFYERLRYLWIPSALPNFITASKTSIGLAWKSGVAAEALVAIPNMLSIGTEISEAKIWLETADQFAWTFVIIVLSLSIEILFSFVAKKATDKIL